MVLYSTLIYKEYIFEVTFGFCCLMATQQKKQVDFSKNTVFFPCYFYHALFTVPKANVIKKWTLYTTL